MVTKVNPVFDTTLPRSFVGKSIQVVEVDFVSAANGEENPGETIEFVLNTIGTVATIIGHSALYDSNTRMLVMIEGDFPTDTYDGTNSETLVAHLEDLIQAGGSAYGPNSFDASSITVAAPAAGSHAGFATAWQADQTNT